MVWAASAFMTPAPANTASGNYTLKGTFRLNQRSSHNNYYGLILGGKELQGANQNYVYFLIGQDGSYLIKHRMGEMIHDLVPLRFPEWTQGRTRRMHGAKYRNAARTCDVIFVNSWFTGREVTQLLGVPAEKIVVAYPGVSLAGDGAADLGRPYVLTVATLEPRKNLETLLAAPLPEGHAVAVVGAAGWGPQRPSGPPSVRHGCSVGVGDAGTDETDGAVGVGAASGAGPSPAPHADSSRARTNTTARLMAGD